VFDGAAEEAVERYVSLIPGSSLGEVMRYGKAGFEIHGQPEGRAMNVDFAPPSKRALPGCRSSMPSSSPFPAASTTIRSTR
jgi:predicted 3-demethylubiquinone-9 3-methyltransferase (glyoxalase superfamily)